MGRLSVFAAPGIYPQPLAFKIEANLLLAGFNCEWESSDGRTCAGSTGAAGAAQFLAAV